jgi:hypothetical protein
LAASRATGPEGTSGVVDEVFGVSDGFGGVGVCVGFTTVAEVSTGVGDGVGDGVELEVPPSGAATVVEADSGVWR